MRRLLRYRMETDGEGRENVVRALQIGSLYRTARHHFASQQMRCRVNCPDKQSKDERSQHWQDPPKDSISFPISVFNGKRKI